MRGERGREAPKSLLEKELIEASANIGFQRSVCALLVMRSVVSCRMGRPPLRERPPPPFIDTRDGAHAQGVMKVVVFPRIAGVQWSSTVGSTLWGMAPGVAVILGIVLGLAEIGRASCRERVCLLV